MKTKSIFLFLLSSLIFLSCDEELECLFGLNPEIKTTSISSAFLNEPYSQRINAEVDNAVNDNSYDYFFNVIGDFPDGIDVVFFPRSIEILGVPEESGEFEFTVFLSVERFEDGGYDSSPTCNDEVRRDYTLIVND